MASFLFLGTYNSPTTKKPVIYPFFKNIHSISAVLSVAYKKSENCTTFYISDAQLQYYTWLHRGFNGRFKKCIYNRMVVPMPRRPTTTIGNTLEGITE
jgi:hypothetical protein